MDRQALKDLGFDIRRARNIRKLLRHGQRCLWALIQFVFCDLSCDYFCASHFLEDKSFDVFRRLILHFDVNQNSAVKADDCQDFQPLREKHTLSTLRS